ncbi:lysosome-associated membrane glycoprotein 2 isoform X2 [Sander lucioperca]|uniref:lysosome-associated membrane glycoprotein 2 isoform X2 n=1 Tax=Sander lucioperca TaxID=283035 RepID=UPI00125DDF01|nr:lysosome-associated membrane glycoprotein 2 isoform X2 [Sander lucioperca]
MYQYATFVLFLTLGIAFQLSHGTVVNVRDKDNQLCLFANLTVNFSVSYEVADNKSAAVEFELPAKVTADESTCDATSSTLKLNFGEGHSWSVNFTINGKMYQADTILFSYNLSDTTVFPNSVLNETKTVAVKPHITDVGVDTCYSCKSKDTIEADAVNQTLWNVLIQAFVSNNSTSENITSCAADVPITPTPTTHATSTTTAAPVTNSTTTAPPPTTTPTPTLPTPTTGKYSIRHDENSTACLIANIGLRIGFKQEEMNFEPNGTKVSGSCGVNSSELILTSNTMTIMLTFTNDTKKFRLHALNITGKTSFGVLFSEANTNLSLWEAAVGTSYMCNKEQNYTITSPLTLYTFNLQVQPFGVKNGVFSTAEECFLDSDLSFLVPIAVGVALSFLIILVLISYLIGRRKSRTGYQSV